MTISMRLAVLMIVTVAVAAGQTLCAAALTLEGPWVQSYKGRTRLAAGRTTTGGETHTYAFAVIEMPEGWKTYWRNPGESGVPPHFDWSGSTNLADANVLYPAPERILDKGGAIVGYRDSVAFPVAVSPKDPSQPIALMLKLQYGMCKDICVPVEADLALTIPPGDSVALTDDMVAFLDRVPRPASAPRPTDPVLVSSKTDLGAKPTLTVEARFPGGGGAADMFLSTPDGAYVPLATRKSESGDTVIFEVDLSQDVDIDSLRGKELGLTLVSATGQSEAVIKLE